MYYIAFVRFIGCVWYRWLVLLIMSGASEQIQLRNTNLFKLTTKADRLIKVLSIHICLQRARGLEVNENKRPK